ncbi:hypothetical protein [Streptomyces sp. NPDC052107]
MAWTSEWQPPKGVTLAAVRERLPGRRARWQRVRMVGVRDLFG